jgi:VWFA-related protein
MKTLVAAGVWLLILSMPAWGQAGGAPSPSNQPSYTLKVNSRVVLTDVTVTDKQGNPVTGLTATDFRLLDNGKTEKLASFEEHRQQTAQFREVSATPGEFNNDYVRHPPAQVNVLLFDTTSIGIVDQMVLFQQMRKFVDQLPPGEPVAVFTRYGAVTVELASFTDDHETLITAIRKAIPRLQMPGSWRASDLDTLLQIAKYLDQIPGRKNLLWFTNGSNMLLGSDPMSIPMDPGARRAIYDLLETERIAIYPIEARGLTVAFGSVAGAIARQQMQMRQDAQATGGAAYVNTNGLALSAGHIVSTDGDYYTLSYAPDSLKNNGKWHKVEVKLAQAGYELSYRRGYFDDNPSQPKTTGGTRTALRAGGTKIDVPDDRTEPLVFNVQVALQSAAAAPRPEDAPLKRGETRYVVKYRVPAKDIFPVNIQGHMGTVELGAAVFVYDHNGELVSRRALKFTLGVDVTKAKEVPGAQASFSHTVDLPQGSNYLYVGVWDMTSGRVGTVNASVDVKKQPSMLTSR